MRVPDLGAGSKVTAALGALPDAFTENRALGCPETGTWRIFDYAGPKTEVMSSYRVTGTGACVPNSDYSRVTPPAELPPETFPEVANVTP